MGGMVAGMRRVLKRRRLDARLRPPLEPEERILAWASTTDERVVVATNRGLWLPEQPPRRIGWHEIHKVAWSGRELAVTAAVEVAAADGYHVMADAPTVVCSLEDPGRLPEQVRNRVNRSIADTGHHALEGGGGVRVVARRVSGVDGLRWTVRYDPGTDADAPAIAAATDALVAAAIAELTATQ